MTSITNQIRYQLVEVSQRNKIPHLACALSCVDILHVLYFHVMRIKPEQPDWPERDRFLLGKGHAVAALYTTLGAKGYFPATDVFSLGENDSAFEEHPGVHAPAGVENVSGSLGHALSQATGMAKAAKIKGLDVHFYVLVGDGELNEGTNWEAAMFAAAHQLDNLTLIVDFNKLQGTGESCQIMQLEPMHDKWHAFGWNTFRVNGHEPEQLLDALRESSIVENQPRVVIADTIKGAGVSFMQNDNNWHYRIPTEEELKLVAVELEQNEK